MSDNNFELQSPPGNSKTNNTFSSVNGAAGPSSIPAVSQTHAPGQQRAPDLVPCSPTEVAGPALEKALVVEDAAAHPRQRHTTSRETDLVIFTAPPQATPDLGMDISCARREGNPNLDNPFRLFPDVTSLRIAVTNFANNHGLGKYVQLLISAAEYERDDDDAQEQIGFPHDEVSDEVSDEKPSFRKQSRSLKVAVLIVGLLSASCQGWNQSVLNGTAPELAKYFNLHVRTDDPLRNNRDLWRLGALVAVEPAAAGLLSIFVSDPLQSRWLGRRGAIALSATVSTVATIALACATTIPQVVGLRLLIGVTLGAKASTINPLLAEITFKFQLRGRILATWQLGDALGIFCGVLSWYIINRAIPVESPDSAERRWRILSLTTLPTSLPLIFVAYTIPESYVFLLKKNKYPKAAESVLSYCRSRLDAMRLLISSHFIWETEANLLKTDAMQELQDRVSSPLGQSNDPPGQCPQSVPKGNGCAHTYHTRFLDFFKRLWQVCWTDVRCQRALLSSGLLMVAQAICGINALAFFSSSMVDAGISEDRSVLLALLFGAVNFGFGLLTLRWTDKYGRTTLALIGLPLMSLSAFILAGLFKISRAYEGPRNAAIITFSLVFTAIYSCTLGPAAYAVGAESFPSSVREISMSVSVFLNMFSLGVFLFTYPVITGSIDYSASLCIFGVIDLIAFVLCFLFCVDTRKRSLDQLQFSFGLPIILHAEYRRFEVLPQLSKWLHPFATFEDDASRISKSDDPRHTVTAFHLWAHQQRDKEQPKLFARVLNLFRPRFESARHDPS